MCVSPKIAGNRWSISHPPLPLTCWCTFVAHWSAGAAAVHIGRFRGDTPRATASVVHVLIRFRVHHAWGSLKGSWGSWRGWAGCHAANLGEIFISWSVANNLQQENRTGTFTPKARCQDQNHLSAHLFLSATVHEGRLEHAPECNPWHWGYKCESSFTGSSGH